MTAHEYGLTFYKPGEIPAGFWEAFSWLGESDLLLIEDKLSDRAWCDSVMAVRNLAGRLAAHEYVYSFLPDQDRE